VIFVLKNDDPALSLTTSPQIRVALYLRVSTKDKGQEAANQANQLREFCSTQVVHEFKLNLVAPPADSAFVISQGRGGNQPLLNLCQICARELLIWAI